MNISSSCLEFFRVSPNRLNKLALEGFWYYSNQSPDIIKLNLGAFFWPTRYTRFYIKERNRIVVLGNQNLIITFGKPHRNALSDIISRWVKEEPLAARIDITCFKTHTCRAVSSSTVNQIGIYYKEFLKRGSCKEEHAFTKICNKHVINNLQDFDYSSVLINKNVSK